jgi:hypothetical protein
MWRPVEGAGWQSGIELEYGGDGELSRTSNWQFDASDGLLLSVSMQQACPCLEITLHFL